jgi:hypothetical protein
MSANARVPQNIALTMTSQHVVGPPPRAADVEELTWQLLDEQIDEPNVRVLERELLSNSSARRKYVDCVQLHVALGCYFREKWNAEHPDQAQPLVKLPFEK